LPPASTTFQSLAKSREDMAPPKAGLVSPAITVTNERNILFFKIASERRTQSRLDAYCWLMTTKSMPPLVLKVTPGLAGNSTVKEPPAMGMSVA
jgi:hypothetical protein